MRSKADGGPPGRSDSPHTSISIPEDDLGAPPEEPEFTDRLLPASSARTSSFGFGFGFGLGSSIHYTTTPVESSSWSQRLQQRKVPNLPEDNHSNGETISLVTMGSSSEDVGNGRGLAPSDANSTREKSRRRERRRWNPFRGKPPQPRTFCINENLETDRRKQRGREFPPNVVRNQKYSILTFIPVVLYNQVGGNIVSE